jgi:hypothetical protein
MSLQKSSTLLFRGAVQCNMMQAVQRLARYKQLIAPMALETTVDQTGSLTVSPGWLFATDIPISLQVAELAYPAATTGNPRTG